MDLNFGIIALVLGCLVLVLLAFLLFMKYRRHYRDHQGDGVIEVRIENIPSFVLNAKIPTFVYRNFANARLPLQTDPPCQVFVVVDEGTKIKNEPLSAEIP